MRFTDGAVKTIGALLLVALGISGCDRERTEATSSIYRVVRKDITQLVTLTGTIVPNRKTVFSPPFPGYVRKIYVNIGDTVRAGAPIVSVSQSLSMSGEDSFPMRAPFAGTVVQVPVAEGQFVDPKNSAGMVRIDDISQLFVSASARESEINLIHSGLTAAIRATSSGSRLYKGIVRNVALAATENAASEGGGATYAVLVEIDGSTDGQLKPGMTALLDIQSGSARSVPAVPQEYLLAAREGIFVVTDKGERKSVKVGVQDDRFAEIRSGVTEGDQLRMPHLTID